jgi:polar amino acid transport system substrate-binding protein
MRLRLAAALVVVLMTASGTSAQRGRVGTGSTLRVAYLATNPAQAVTDPKTGEVRGVAIELANALALRQRMALALVPAPNPQAVIDAVQSGKVDIGFIAYNPERAGAVEFSRPYLLVQQTFLVRDDSPLRSVSDVDRDGVRIGARAGDSIALYLARTLKQARLVELTEADTRDAPAMVRGSKLDAFGANRQRLTDILRATPGLRLLPDDLYGVEQAIVVSRGNVDGLNSLNDFIEDVRRSGFIDAAIARSGVVGIAAVR